VRRRPTIRFVSDDPMAVLAHGTPIERLPARPYALDATVCAVVDTPAVGAAVLHALARGADAVVMLRLDDASEFVEATQRLADVSVPAPAVLARDQVELLELLAAGHTLAEAATTLGLSSRTAHRRLGGARAVLGAATNAEAIARLHVRQ
jgi:DNA-binding CsgD family transcriptional regulator